MLDTFYLNYYSLAMISSFVQAIGSGIALFLVPKRSRTTMYMAATLIFIGLIDLFYIIGQGFYKESFVPGRVIILIVIYIMHMLFTQTLLRFPTNLKPFFTRVNLAADVLFTIGMSVYITINLLPSPFYYSFSGHYYEYDNPVVLKIYGLGVVLYFGLKIIAIAIWKLIKMKDNGKKAVVYLFVGIILGSIIPAVFNSLNRDGLLDRSAYISIFCQITMIGAFIMLVGYINHTRDKTTFMFKVVGISFLIFLLVSNIVFYVVMSDREKLYDLLHTNRLQSIVEHNEETEDLKFIITYSADSGEIQYNLKDSNIKLAEEPFKYEITNAFILETINRLPAAAKKEEIIQKLKSLEDIKNTTYSRGYLEFMIRYLEKENSSEDGSAKRLVNHMISKEKYFFYRFNKIKDMPEKNFKGTVEKYIASDKEEFDPFKKVLLNHIQEAVIAGVEENRIKKEILYYLSPMKLADSRRYRENPYSREGFVSYYYFGKDGLIYEVGFTYLGYRNFLHSLGKTLFYVILIGMLLIVVGSPVFLKGTLTNPLNALLSGLRKVKKGDLTIKVPVQVQDEIGYLAGSFNNMVTSIRDSREKLEEYSNNLEQKVEDRTKELLLTLSEVEKLKVQQDGDYFLTTLLLKPLSINNTRKSEKIKIDFIVKQKKQFKFRTHSHDIGGDICIAQSIKLRGKNYITFLNADAMGKSMQGAGGVLVLGSVFQSIIQRTISYSSESNIYPEKWIKNAFKEMHKIFESFDGSMLVSLIFGLVEEESGLVYFINAEHPWLVLHRDRRAEFLENDLNFRKLGTSGLKNELFVTIFQMMPGDCLIIGSDGKDDLVLEKSEEKRVINEDEFLFLNRVMEADGDIHKIYDNIKSNYELIDDFSLMSIHYQISESDLYEVDREHEVIEEAKSLMINKKTSAAIELLERTYSEDKKRHSRIARSLIKYYMKKEKYKQAADICKEYLDYNEVDTGHMLKAAYCLKMSGEYEKAIELSERVRLREPYNVRNLILLAGMYVYAKNNAKALKIANKILMIDSFNPSAMKIRDRALNISGDSNPKAEDFDLNIQEEEMIGAGI